MLEESLGMLTSGIHTEVNIAQEEKPEFLDCILKVALDSGCGEHVADETDAPCTM